MVNTVTLIKAEIDGKQERKQSKCDGQVVRQG